MESKLNVYSADVSKSVSGMDVVIIALGSEITELVPFVLKEQNIIQAMHTHGFTICQTLRS